MKEKAKRINITLPPKLHDQSMNLVQEYQFTDFSSLVQHLLRQAVFTPSGLFQNGASMSQIDSSAKISALKRLQQQLKMTPEKAKAWETTIRDARR